MTPDQLERFDAEEASGTVHRLLRTAELDGTDVRSVLIEAVQGRELDSVDSLAQVLAWRIQRQLEEAARHRADPDLAEFVPRSYAERTPAAADELSVYVEQLAALM